MTLTSLMHFVDLIAEQLHSPPVNRGVLGLDLSRLVKVPTVATLY